MSEIDIIKGKIPLGGTNYKPIIIPGKILSNSELNQNDELTPQNILMGEDDEIYIFKNFKLENGTKEYKCFLRHIGWGNYRYQTYTTSDDLIEVVACNEKQLLKIKKLELKNQELERKVEKLEKIIDEHFKYMPPSREDEIKDESGYHFAKNHFELLSKKLNKSV